MFKHSFASRLDSEVQNAKYQGFLYDMIKGLHDGGMGYRQIAQWLREKDYKTPRGKGSRGPKFIQSPRRND